MKKIVINKSYDKFSVSHQAFIRLRELGQPDALKEDGSRSLLARGGDTERTEPQSVRETDSAR